MFGKLGGSMRREERRRNEEVMLLRPITEGLMKVRREYKRRGKHGNESANEHD